MQFSVGNCLHLTDDMNVVTSEELIQLMHSKFSDDSTVQE